MRADYSAISQSVYNTNLTFWQLDRVLQRLTLAFVFELDYGKDSTKNVMYPVPVTGIRGCGMDLLLADNFLFQSRLTNTKTNINP